MTLYEISNDLKAFIDAYEAGEIPEEAYVDTLNAIELAFEDKADNIAKAITNINSDISALQTEIKRLQELQKIRENHVKNLKNYLYEQMKAIGKTKFSTPLFNFTICKNGGLQPIEITGDVPSEYCDLVPNNTLIRDAIKEGVEIKFAKILERGEHLRIK
jgi:hypothetical protein